MDILEVTERLLDGDGPSVSMMMAPMRVREKGDKKNDEGGKHSDMSQEQKDQISVSGLLST